MFHGLSDISELFDALYLFKLEIVISDLFSIDMM